MDHIFTLNSLIQNRQSTFATFVDFRKAFDCVDRNLLQYKLQLNGIDGPMYNAIASLYSNTESCVSLNGFQTEWFNCTNVVRQGDNLSPTLFSIFINDLANEIKEANRGIPVKDDNICLLLYADDIVLLEENENDIQHVLDILWKWCEKWRINVNISKSNVMHFRIGQLPRSTFNFKIGNRPLLIVKQYRYLSVTFHEKIKFREAAETLSKGGGQALGNLGNLFNIK